MPEHREGPAATSDSAALATLRGKIADRAARVGIIGLGYVGLLLARPFAARGIRVLSLDIDPTTVAILQHRRVRPFGR